MLMFGGRTQASSRLWDTAHSGLHEVTQAWSDQTVCTAGKVLSPGLLERLDDLGEVERLLGRQGASAEQHTSQGYRRELDHPMVLRNARPPNVRHQPWPQAVGWMP